MPGEAGPAVHERIIAISEHVVINVAEIGCGRRIALLRHPHQFRPLKEDQLRVLHPVGFNECSIPGRTTETGGERVYRKIGCAGVIYWIAESRAEPWAVRSVLGHDLKIEPVEIEEPNESFATVTLVPNSRVGQGHTAIGEEGRGGLADHSVETYPVGSELSDIKSLTAGKERAIGIAAVRKVGVAVGGT